MKDILQNQAKIYGDNFRNNGDSPQGVFWNNSETQELRFIQLLKHFDTTQKFSIHDIGSGLSDLHKFLLHKKIEHDYIGTEIVPEMIELSRNKFPNVKIFNRDILANTNIDKCDIVTLSGTFNFRAEISNEEWKNHTFQMIKKMFELSHWGISFNFLTSYNTFSDKSLAYFDPCQLFDFCMHNLSRFVILDHAYPLFEGTITVFQESYLKQTYSNAAFKKYFGK